MSNNCDHRDDRRVIHAGITGQQWERLTQLSVALGYGPKDCRLVLEKLLDHVDQGLTRPGSWEREWLLQAIDRDVLDNYDHETRKVRGDGDQT